MLVVPRVFRAPEGLTRRAGLLCVPVGGGPPARRPRRELRSARRLEARPGPAGPAAASNRAGLVVSVLSVSLRHRPRAPQPALRCPPHRRRLVADVWLSASARSRTRTCHSPRTSEISRVKPSSPLLARVRVGLKPASPLRVRNGRFGCVYRLQRCCRFHVGPYQRLQRCHWFHSRHVAVSCARKSSPCVLRKAHDRRFMAYWASYFAKMPLEGLRWANVVAPLALLACHATIRGSGQARRPQPGRSRSRVIAPNEPPALASCGGGRQYEESSSDKQRNRCKRR